MITPVNSIGGIKAAASPSVQSASPIEREISRLEGIGVELADVVNGLENRISDILIPSPGDVQVECARNIYSVPMAERLSRIGDNNASSLERLRDIISRIQL